MIHATIHGILRRAGSSDLGMYADMGSQLPVMLVAALPAVGVLLLAWRLWKGRHAFIGPRDVPSRA